MTKIGDLIGEQSDELSRNMLSVGDVHIIPMGKDENITTKNGKSYRDKFIVILGFDDYGNAVGGGVVNSKVNNNLPSSITDYYMPISASKFPFLRHNSYINCSHLVVAKKDKFNSSTFRGCINDEETIQLIMGTLSECPAVDKQQLIEFGIVSIE